ncbi:MAG: hypothetical protein QME51_10340, partial [Planctomycetota bacterium]|nr:hypothetical protein [Planctomycetota bacterium]
AMTGPRLVIASPDVTSGRSNLTDKSALAMTERQDGDFILTKEGLFPDLPHYQNEEILGDDEGIEIELLSTCPHGVPMGSPCRACEPTMGRWWSPPQFPPPPPPPMPPPSPSVRPSPSTRR